MPTKPNEGPYSERAYEEGARPAHQGGGTPPLHKGWYVPRRLPHFDSAQRVQAITFRLADSLPREAIARLAASGDAERRAKAAALPDAGLGCCLLADPRHAGAVETALLHFAGIRYALYAWVVMPNHVHALIEPINGHRLPDILHSWKSWTAKRINRDRGGNGPVWHGEFFDRYIRNEDRFHRVLAYIENNPVKAGLAPSADKWRFGSAWEGARPAQGSEEGARPAHQGGGTPPLHHSAAPGVCPG